jgi:hypothetical protein
MLRYLMAVFLILIASCSQQDPYSYDHQKWNTRFEDNTLDEKMQTLFPLLRNSIITGEQLDDIKVSLPFNNSHSYVAISLYQDNLTPLRKVSKREDLEVTINRVIELIRDSEEFALFRVNESNICRIQLEIVTEARPTAYQKISETRFSDDRFEPGITGLMVETPEKTVVYMPTYGYSKNHLTMRQVLSYLSQQFEASPKSGDTNERIDILKQETTGLYLLESISYLNIGDDVVPLYRGMPMDVDISDDKISAVLNQSGEWILQNRQGDGRFLYYYDGIRDSIIDHEHPTRTLENNYYNILRHSGGIIAVLNLYDLTGDSRYLAAAEDAIDYLVIQSRTHEYKNKTAYYVFYNDKSKLGGTGIALAALMRHRELTGSSKHEEHIHGYARHLLSRIDEEGEFIGYYIHPDYNKGRPILDPSEEEKEALFSFYYPGEALLGLALYERDMDLSKEQKEELQQAMLSAGDFLVFDRPVKYEYMFEDLPSDGWLMQAFEVMADSPELSKQEYIEFVFNDTQKMLSHMYSFNNSPYYDYPGGFYYRYGDHVYPDSARAEGLISAYYLAKKTENKEMVSKLERDLPLIVRSTLIQYNDAGKTYPHMYPWKSIGSYRFKLTRHWVRIDTSQHSVNFLYRYITREYKN